MEYRTPERTPDEEANADYFHELYLESLVDVFLQHIKERNQKTIENEAEKKKEEEKSQ